ncbi:MAG: hypothetical protein OEL81_03235 [Nitrosopumilus sp.]|nr:hypothetical protein [Nitrosopumilus sp.]
MKTRYKITLIVVCAYFGVFFGPVATSNVYCDFISQEMCTSRITGVGLPPFNMIPVNMPTDNECFFENAEGVMEPCYTEIGYFNWPFPQRAWESVHDLRCDEICIDDESSKDELNFSKLIRNDENHYCVSINEESSGQCYSLEEIVFGNARKDWTVYPGGAGWMPPDNSTLTRIYNEVEFGVPSLNFTAMLNDKLFVDKCESNGGVWNYTYHDCEALWQVCTDVGGIIVEEDVTPPCTDTGIIDDPLKVKVCRGAELLRVSCVFEYEN